MSCLKGSFPPWSVQKQSNSVQYEEAPILPKGFPFLVLHCWKLGVSLLSDRTRKWKDERQTWGTPTAWCVSPFLSCILACIAAESYSTCLGGKTWIRVLYLLVQSPFVRSKGREFDKQLNRSNANRLPGKSCGLVSEFQVQTWSGETDRDSRGSGAQREHRSHSKLAASNSTIAGKNWPREHSEMPLSKELFDPWY